MKSYLSFFIASFLFFACTATEVAPTPQPTTSTQTPQTPSTLKLTFDGSSCVYEGPSTLKPGPVTLQFINESDVWAAVSFLRHTGDETIEDVIQYIGDEPSTVTSPRWVTHLGTYRQQVQAGESYLFERDLIAGLHHMVCIRGVNRGVWFGAGILVED